MPKAFRIDFRPITVPKDFPMSLYNRVENTLEDFLKKEVGPEIKKDMQGATSTWNHKPDFPVEFRYLQYKMWVQVVPSGVNKDKWKFVSRGTRVRHARMSDDFQAKTRPGSLKSRAGRGGVVAISKSIVKPGVEARKFEEQILEKRENDIRVRASNKVKWALR